MNLAATDVTSPAPTPPPSQPRDWFVRGMLDACGLPALMMLTTMCGIGGLVRDVGFPVWAGTLSTLLMWAGPAQVILFGAIAVGASLPATAFAIALSSARFLPMTVAILPLVRTRNTPLSTTILAAHMVAMTTWIEGQRRLPLLPEMARQPYFFGYALVIMMVGVTMTHLGYYLYALLPAFLVVGFLFTTPLFFTAAMISNAKGIVDWLALAIGFLVTPLVTAYLPTGFDFLIIGLVGGTLAYMVHRKLAEPERGAHDPD